MQVSLAPSSTWGVTGVSLYLFCLGLPLNEVYSTCLIGLLAAVLFFFGSETNFRISKPILVSLVVFVLLTVISSLLSVDPSRSLTIDLSLFPAAIIFIVITDQLDLQHIFLVFFALTLAAIVISCTLLMSYWFSSSDDPIRWMEDASFTFLVAPNDLILVALTAPLTVALTRVMRSRLISLVALVSLVLALTTIVVFRSNAALLVLFAELTIMGVILWRKQLALIMVIFIFLAIIGDSIQGFLLFEKLSNPIVWGNRVPLWLAAVHMFLDAPFFGHGPGSFSVLSGGYIERLQLPDWTVMDPRHAPWAHNLYLELLAERGVLGLLSFVALLGLTVKQLASNTAGMSNDVTVALLACFTGVILVGIFELSLLRHWFLVMLATFVAFSVVLARKGVSQRDRNSKNEQPTF